MRECIKCHWTRSLSFYALDKRTNDGWAKVCNMCKAAGSEKELVQELKELTEQINSIGRKND